MSDVIEVYKWRSFECASSQAWDVFVTDIWHSARHWHRHICRLVDCLPLLMS